MKKVVAVLMSICLLVAFFPAGGLAVSADAGDISKTEVESNNYMSLADLIYDDYTVSGVVSGTDMDYFKFTLPTRSTIRIITIATYKSCFMAGVFTPSEVAVAVSSFVEYSDSGYPSYLTTATLDAGTYYYVIFNEDASSLRNVYTFYFTYSSSHTHTYDNACDATCNGCSYTRSVSHTYDADCDTVCNVCGVTRTSSVSHTVDGDCDTACNLCQAKVTASGSHTYTNKCDASCDVCGYTRKVSHVYDNKCDTSCNLCKAKRTTAHSYKTTTTKATLSKNGKSVKKCTVCGKVASNKVIKYAKTFKLSATSYTYDGKVKAPTVTVKDAAGKTLKKNTDYTVTYASGRKNAGTYKVTVKMKGNYSGTKTLTFKIKPVSLSKCKVSLSKTTYTYNGSVKKPTVTVKTASGTKIATTSYKVTYASGRKNVGTYKVTIKGKGNCTGTKTLTFKINPPTTSVSKLTAEKKSIKVSYTKKTTQVTGYQIQYSTSKSFKSYKTKTVTSAKTASATLSGLKTKTIYYVRVRTYKTVGKTKYYSAWSSVKSKCTAHTHAYSGASCKYCKQANPKYKTYGSSLRYKDDYDEVFTLTFGSTYSFAQHPYDGTTFVRIPITMKNNNSVTADFEWTNMDLSSSNNVTNYDGYSSIIISMNYFDDGETVFSNLRPNASVTGAVYIPYTGPGYYAIMLDDLDDVVIEFYVG